MSDDRVYPIYPIGAQIILNSGSPILTVVDFDIELKECTVGYYDNQNNYHEFTSPTICLRPFANTYYI